MARRGVFIFLLAAVSGCAAPCATPLEQTALRARAVQSDLVVAALNCDRQDRYAAFVQRFDDQLAEQGQRLKSFFLRGYGSDGEAELNRYVTSLANRASTRSARFGATFCAQADARFAELMALEPALYGGFVDRQPLRRKADFETCGS